MPPLMNLEWLESYYFSDFFKCFGCAGVRLFFPHADHLTQIGLIGGNGVNLFADGIGEFDDIFGKLLLHVAIADLATVVFVDVILNGIGCRNHGARVGRD